MVTVYHCLIPFDCILINFSESSMAADFLYDVTIPDGTRVQPETRLMKTWRIRNAGTAKWTDSTKVVTTFIDIEQI